MSRPSALVSNNAVTTILSALDTTDTSVILAAGTGALFPSPTNGNYFFATLSANSGVNEIVKCTNRNVDTLTIQRGQDNTTSKSWLAGSFFELRIVAGTINAAMAWNALYGEADGVAPLDSSAKLDTVYLYVGGSDGLVQLVSGAIPMAVLPAGVANGLATLDATGVVPSSQLPVLDYLPTTGGTLTGDLTIDTNLDVLGTANVGGDATIGGGLKIDGVTGEAYALDVTGQAHISLELIVDNDAYIGNELNVTSDVNALQHNGVLAPTGNSGGKIAKITYSASAPGAPTVADGEWWIQYE